MMMGSIVAQLFNVSFWKCLKLGGVILTATGFFQWGFILDHIRERFLIFCTFIGLIVVYYRFYYIFKSEISLFRRIIVLFITRILLLTSGSNIMTMFVGWERVGVISFILIGWFMSREKAISASFYAFTFNRFADYFFLILLLWEVGGEHRLFYLQNSDDLSFQNNVSLGVLALIGLSIWIASAGKSAQFAFHPWLTFAIEGPTPVRSLLHSSTIVVAGVYLLLKLHPLIISFNWLHLNNLILFSRMVTIVFTSLWAISQIDIKKIIALSTTSQLSLIIIMCSVGQYDLAFIHLVFHGFFKALLFLGRGVVIHNSLTAGQDIIKLNLLIKGSSFLHTVFVIGVLGLIGAPFIGSFYRKHLILDSVISISQFYCIRMVFYTGIYFSPIFTLGYSLKLLSYISKKPSSTILSSSYIKGSYSDWEVVVPLFLLCIFSFAIGSSLWKNIRDGLRVLLSHEDLLFSIFFFILFLGFIYYTVLTYDASKFIYNLSSSVIKLNMLYLQKLLTMCLFQLVEFLYLKKGLKGSFPSHSVKRGQSLLLIEYSSLELTMFTFLFNLTITILLIHFTFILII